MQGSTKFIRKRKVILQERMLFSYFIMHNRQSTGQQRSKLWILNPIFKRIDFRKDVKHCKLKETVQYAFNQFIDWTKLKNPKYQNVKHYAGKTLLSWFKKDFPTTKLACKMTDYCIKCQKYEQLIKNYKVLIQKKKVQPLLFC
jgi:hypothetical protein